MSAKVKPNTSRGWDGLCLECKTSISGELAFVVDLWADVHNELHHGDES